MPFVVAPCWDLAGIVLALSFLAFLAIHVDCDVCGHSSGQEQMCRAISQVGCMHVVQLSLSQQGALCCLRQELLLLGAWQQL